MTPEEITARLLEHGESGEVLYGALGKVSLGAAHDVLRLLHDAGSRAPDAERFAACELRVLGDVVAREVVHVTVRNPGTETLDLRAVFWGDEC